MFVEQIVDYELMFPLIRLKNPVYTLHTLFFSSLAHLNPAVKNSPRIMDVLRFTAAIRKNMDGLNRLSLSPAQHEYVMKVRDNVLHESENDLEELARFLKTIFLVVHLKDIRT